MVARRILSGKLSTGRTHRASLFDSVLNGVQQLPISVWVIYPVALGLLIVAFNALAWVAGLTPVGTFDLYRSSIPCYPIGSMMLIEYLNRVARRAFASFRPALTISDHEYLYLEYQLITMPRRGVHITLLLSLGLVTVYIINTPYIHTLFQTSHLIAIIECVFYVFAFAVMAIYFYHILWQLRMVSGIHAMLTHVDLFNRESLYAFSQLSSHAGISLLLMTFFGIVTDPATFSNIALINVTVIAFILAILSFVLPLQGIYRHIIAEKYRLTQAIDAEIGTLIQHVYASNETPVADDVVRQTLKLNSLATIRKTVEDIPTLPLQRGTLISFVSVFILTFLGRIAVAAIATLIV